MLEKTKALILKHWDADVHESGYPAAQMDIAENQSLTGTGLKMGCHTTGSCWTLIDCSSGEWIVIQERPDFEADSALMLGIKFNDALSTRQEATLQHLIETLENATSVDEAGGMKSIRTLVSEGAVLGQELEDEVYALAAAAATMDNLDNFDHGSRREVIAAATEYDEAKASYYAWISGEDPEWKWLPEPIINRLIEDRVKALRSWVKDNPEVVPDIQVHGI